MKVLFKKEVYGSREQCMRPIENTPQQNAHLKKKEKKKRRKRKRKMLPFHQYPIGY